MLRAALLAEMDALPGIGHACGHNLSGPASLLAASALAEVLPPEELALTVIGCPAEETGVGKRRLVDAGNKMPLVGVNRVVVWTIHPVLKCAVLIVVEDLRSNVPAQVGLAGEYERLNGRAGRQRAAGSQDQS